MITIQNNGQDIVSTNYWGTPHAREGYVYLSWNAGAARLLIPDATISMLQEIKTGKEVIVSRGLWREYGNRDALELVWEDNTEFPFSICLVSEQCDRLIPDTEQGGGFVVAAWTREGKRGDWPGKYRVVKSLPCLEPWKAN